MVSAVYYSTINVLIIMLAFDETIQSAELVTEAHVKDWFSKQFVVRSNHFRVICLHITVSRL